MIKDLNISRKLEGPVLFTWGVISINFGTEKGNKIIQFNKNYYYFKFFYDSLIFYFDISSLILIHGKLFLQYYVI